MMSVRVLILVDASHGSWGTDWLGLFTQNTQTLCVLIMVHARHDSRGVWLGYSHKTHTLHITLSTNTITIITKSQTLETFFTSESWREQWRILYTHWYDFLRVLLHLMNERNYRYCKIHYLSNSNNSVSKEIFLTSLYDTTMEWRHKNLVL